MPEVEMVEGVEITPEEARRPRLEHGNGKEQEGKARGSQLDAKPSKAGRRQGRPPHGSPAERAEEAGRRLKAPEPASGPYSSHR